MLINNISFKTLSLISKCSLSKLEILGPNGEIFERTQYTILISKLSINDMINFYTINAYFYIFRIYLCRTAQRGVEILKIAFLKITKFNPQLNKICVLSKHADQYISLYNAILYIALDVSPQSCWTGLDI